MTVADSKPNSTTHYLDDGDTLEFGSITDWSQLSAWTTYDKVFLVAHGSTSIDEHYVGGAGMSQSSLDGNIVLWGCNPTHGAVSLSHAGALFHDAAEILLE